MKKRIKYLIGLAHGEAPVQSVPEPMPEKTIADAVEDCNNGKVLLVQECADKWRCSTDSVIKLIKNKNGVLEPGVFRVGSDYRIPQSVYQRILERMMCTQ